MQHSDLHELGVEKQQKNHLAVVRVDIGYAKLRSRHVTCYIYLDSWPTRSEATWQGERGQRGDRKKVYTPSPRALLDDKANR